MLKINNSREYSIPINWCQSTSSKISSPCIYIYIERPSFKKNVCLELPPGCFQMRKGGIDFFSKFELIYSLVKKNVKIKKKSTSFCALKCYQRGISMRREVVPTIHVILFRPYLEGPCVTTYLI